MGAARTEVGGGSEITLDGSPQSPKIIATVPPNACEGQMTFVKRSTGDTVYIKFKGGTPSSKNYDVILTDAIPVYSEDGLVIGDIKAVGTVATSLVSGYISFRIQ
jgi:hypothetical protein